MFSTSRFLKKSWVNALTASACVLHLLDKHVDIFCDAARRLPRVVPASALCVFDAAADADDGNLLRGGDDFEGFDDGSGDGFRLIDLFWDFGVCFIVL